MTKLANAVIRSDRTAIYEQDFSIGGQPVTLSNQSIDHNTTATPQKAEPKYKVWSAFSTSNLNPDKNTHELSDFYLDSHYENQEGLVGSFTEIADLYRPLMVRRISNH